jgi:TolB-like protein
VIDPPRSAGGASLWQRLRRRKVVQWGVAYGAAAWGFLQGLEYVSESFGWSTELRRLAIIALTLGLPIVMVVAWYHGDRGEQRVTRVELAILTLLFLAGGGIFWSYREASETAPAAGPADVASAAHANDRSIAVLPFVNMSADKDQEYFADGIAEELLNLLTQVPQLRVISRASAFSFKGRNLEVPDIARRLNVAHVLEGSVRRSGGRVRITAQLVDARSDTQMWSQSWDRELGDIFAVQDEIAAAVVAQLKLRLLGAPPKSRPMNPQAYALFLQARGMSNQLTGASYRQAEELYRQSLSLEPDNAPALTGLAVNYFRMVSNRLMPASQGFALAREAVDRAIAADPKYAQAYATSGLLAIFGNNDLVLAAREMNRAVELEPGDPVVLDRSAALLYHLGRIDQSIALGESLIKRDPLYAVGRFNLAIRYYTARRPQDAIESYELALALSPDAGGAHGAIADALLLQGRNREALEAAQQEKSEPDRQLSLARAYASLGDRRESDGIVASAIAAHGQDWTAEIAATLASLGEVDRAFEWLDKALSSAGESGDPLLSELVVQPYFDKVRGDRRWLPFLRRIGRAPEQLEAIKFEVDVPD